MEHSRLIYRDCNERRMFERLYDSVTLLIVAEARVVWGCQMELAAMNGVKLSEKSIIFPAH